MLPDSYLRYLTNGMRKELDFGAVPVRLDTRGSRNPYLRQEILRLRTRTGAYRKHAFGSVGRIQTSYGHHQDIIDAIRASDSKAAASTMFLHMSPGHGTRGVADIIVNMPKELLG